MGDRQLSMTALASLVHPSLDLDVAASLISQYASRHHFSLLDCIATGAPHVEDY